MPADTDDRIATILAFACQLADQEGRGTSDEAGRTVARERGWIDGAGLPTGEGCWLCDELARQDGTRSVFRALP